MSSPAEVAAALALYRTLSRKQQRELFHKNIKTLQPRDNSKTLLYVAQKKKFNKLLALAGTFKQLSDLCTVALADTPPQTARNEAIISGLEHILVFTRKALDHVRQNPYDPATVQPERPEE